MKALEKESFWALIATQFFAAFNDNALKVLVSLLIVQWVTRPMLRNDLVDLSGIVFVAPFLLFSMVAGRVADRLGKPKVVILTNSWGLLVAGVAIYSLFVESIPWMMLALFLLSVQGVFFSPAKYGILPELMGEDEIADANGYLNAGTFLAILIGTLVAPFMAMRLHWAIVIMGSAAVAGLTAGFLIEPLPAAKPGEPLAWNAVADFLENWRILSQDRILKLSIIAVNYFWFLGAILQLNIFLYAKVMMNASLNASAALVVAVTLGISSGSVLAGWLSRGRVDWRLVPLGALGMSGFALGLFVAHRGLGWAMLDYFMLGFSGGFYVVPLNAIVQWRSPAAERGRILATENFLSFVAILAASGTLLILGGLLRLNPAQAFLFLGSLSLAATVWILARYPVLWQQKTPKGFGV